MLVDRQSRPWIITSLILFIIATIAYVPYARSQPNGPTGGSIIGLAYGIAGTAFMAFAMLLALKKRFRTLRVGRAYTWMQGHVWLSLLSYLLILYHAGLHWGQAWNLTWVMMWIFTIVVASGVIGIILQNTVPTKMLSDVPMETIFDEINHVVKQLAGEADAIAKIACSTEEEAYATDVIAAGAVGTATLAPTSQLALARTRFADFYDARVKPYLASPRGRNLLLSDRSRSAVAFEDIRRALPIPMREQLNDLESIADERRQLEQQRRLHHWLHSWLYVHVPLSYALTVLAAYHIVIALRYR